MVKKIDFSIALYYYENIKYKGVVIMAKNYTEGKNKIFVRNADKLTKKEKAEIKLLSEITGKKIEFPKDKKENTGYTKAEIIRYLENVAPADKVKEFTDICESKNYMAALQWFKKWYKSVNNADYKGEAAKFIKD